MHSRRTRLIPHTSSASIAGGFAEVVLGSIADHYNGSYSVRLRPIIKGPYIVSVTLDGHHAAHQIERPHLIQCESHAHVDALHGRRRGVGCEPTGDQHGSDAARCCRCEEEHD